MPRVSPGWVQQALNSADFQLIKQRRAELSAQTRTAWTKKNKTKPWSFWSLYVCTYAGFHFNWWSSIRAQAFNSKDYVHLLVRRSVRPFIQLSKAPVEKMDELLKCNRCVLNVTRQKGNNHINYPSSLNTTTCHKPRPTRVWMKRYQTAKYSHYDVVLAVIILSTFFCVCQLVLEGS